MRSRPRGKLCEMQAPARPTMSRCKVRPSALLSPAPIHACASIAEAAKLQFAVSAEVDLDEMTFDAERRTYTWPCRCSSQFEIDEAALERGVDLASCFGCSAHIRVLYQTVE